MTSNQLADLPILDLTSSNDDAINLLDDRSSIIGLNNENSSTSNTIRIPAISGFRLTNLLRLLIFIEFLVLLIIWLTGSRTHSLIDDIIHFHLTTSIFDLVILALCKLILLVVLLTELETRVIISLYRPIVRSTFTCIRSIFTVALIVITTGTFSFAIVKLILVLRNFHLSKLDLACVYIFLIFSTLELIGSLLIIPYLRQLKLLEQQRTSDQTNKKVDISRVLSLAKAERSLIVTGTFFLIISSSTQIVDIIFFGKTIGSALTSQSMDSVNRNVIILICIDFVGSIAVFFYSWLFELAGQKMIARLRQNIFRAIVEQEIPFFDENNTGELTNRLSSDAQVVQNSVTGNISTLLENSIHVIGSLAVMCYLEITLTLLLVVIVPIVVLIAMKYGQVVENLRKKFQDQLAEANTIATESISNIRTVRIFGSENKVIKNYSDNVFKSFVIGRKLAFNDGLFSGVLELLIAIAVATIMWYGGKLLHDQKLSVGVLTSFFGYIIQVAVAFAFVASLYGDFRQAVGASERLFSLLDRRPKIPATSNDSCLIHPIDFDGSIRFDHVSFTYPTRPEQRVLTNISFTIKHRQKVALVGPSGGGKSTIASLIERFYDPDSGTIYFNSQPLTSIDPQWLRQNVSFVNQEPSLFACSIRDNITFGVSRATISLDEIIQVAKLANAHEFIEQFENKYDTLVGERGVRLSGGQRQRLASEYEIDNEPIRDYRCVSVARALLMNPKLLLLDEATSALDAENEYLIEEAIDRAIINRTVLVIAHRLSTVRNADLVLVIDQGQIVEQGTHDSLISKDDGIYKNLALRQLMPATSS